MSNAGTWDQLLAVTQSKLGGGSAGERRKVAIAKVSPNPDQPRKFFDALALDELAASIKEHGVLQPILVRPHPVTAGQWQIVAGERRWLAAQQAGLSDMPVVVREIDDRTALELGLIENVLREDITPMEEARALKALLDITAWSYSQLGDRLGKNKAWVDHRVRLLKMPDEVQEALERRIVGPEGKVARPFTPRHAGVVVQAPDAETRATLIATIFDEGLSVAEADRRLKGPARLETVVAGMPADGGGAIAPGGVAQQPDGAIAPTRPTKAPGRKAPQSPSIRVDVAGLRVYQIIQAALAGNGTADVSELLVALDADKARLLG